MGFGWPILPKEPAGEHEQGGSGAAEKAVNGREGNLPVSKEGGQGDRDRANKIVPHEQKVPLVRWQPFVRPYLVPARPG